MTAETSSSQLVSARPILFSLLYLTSTSSLTSHSIIMSGLALPTNKAASKRPAPQNNAVASSSKPSGAGANPSSGGMDEDDEELMEKRPVKAVVGVPEITAVQGLVPTLQ